MGWNWNNYNVMWNQRRKNAASKRLWRDTDLTQDDDGTFHLHHTTRVWEQNNGKWGSHRSAGVKLASITKDNVLTLEYETRPDITVCNRLTEILGRTVWSNTTNHRNKVSSVRIRAAKWNRAAQCYAPDRWCPEGRAGDWVKGTIPYETNMKFQLCELTGEPLELLTPVEDVSILVKNEAIQQAKADTKILRTLVRSMARMGSFDEQMEKKMSGGYWPAAAALDLGKVNYKSPMGADAEAVFCYGLVHANRPDTHRYENKQWVKRSPDEIRAAMIDTGIDNGMRALRKYIYSTTDGYERIVK